MNSFYSKTFMLCCLVAIIDRADQMLLPAVYYEVSQSLHLGPVMLSTISACRGVTESLSSLVSGPLGEKYDRVYLIALGCIVWAVSTAAVGASTSVRSLIISRMFNGFGLGFVTPPVFGIVSDLFVEEKRGRAFGVIGTSSNLGAALGSLLATSVAGSVENGWRVAFYLVAAMASILAAMIVLFGEEPRNRNPHVILTQSDNREQSHTSSINHGDDEVVVVAKAERETRSLWLDVKSILKLRTFWILMIQGIFFEIPWYAMNFFTMWLELSGWSHMLSASIRLCFDIGMTVGVLIGGRLSDLSNIWNKEKGRILVSQCSVGIGIPMWLLILQVSYSHNGTGGFALALVVLLTGLTTQYGFPCKAAMLAEISPRIEMRTLVYALSRAGEGTLAAAASPVVGILAEKVFKFRTSQDSDEDDDRGDSRGASSSETRALSHAMVVAMTIPWALCVLVLTLAYWTYPNERTKVDDTGGGSHDDVQHSIGGVSQVDGGEFEEDEEQVEVELSITKTNKRGDSEISRTFNPFHSISDQSLATSS